MNYPLNMSFKVISWGPQVTVTDASGQEVMFVHMKALKLKEDVAIYRNSSKTQEIGRIRADRVIDFSARYRFIDSNSGQEIGSVKREGMRSLWKASYNVLAPGSDQITHHLKEDNPWVRVLNTVLMDVPLLGMFSGYFFNPSYTLFASGSETPIYTLVKQPAFFEGKFEVNMVGQAGNDEARLLFSLIMITLLERMRG